MYRFLALATALLVLVLTAPFAFAGEPIPPAGYERLIVYWAGTCGSGTVTYNGHVEMYCDYTRYGQGARSGQWRHLQDTSCIDPNTTINTYEVCTSGSNCNYNGTWQAITQAQFLATYCP